jgi:hypothetical protein
LRKDPDPDSDRRGLKWIRIRIVINSMPVHNIVFFSILMLGDEKYEENSYKGRRNAMVSSSVVLRSEELRSFLLTEGQR